jgi:hypothetical protein
LKEVSMHAARRRALCQQGAALVEGLIVACLLMLFMAGAVLVHSLYSAKVASIARAREQAWARALPGCEGGLTSLLLNGLTAGAFDAVSGLDAAGVVDTPDWMGNFARGVGSPPAVSIAAPQLIGGGAFQVRARTSVACNEFGDDEEGSLLVNAADIIRDLIPGILDR